jgi:UDPglucose 6-dehydrogenase
MDLSIIGSGYVGLVTGACFADVGHNVICIDNDLRKVESLRKGKVPIYEPGSRKSCIVTFPRSDYALLTASRRASITRRSSSSLSTPQDADGSVDLSFIERVAREIAGVLTDYRVIVDKSTVPVKTGEKVAESIKRYNKHGAEFDVVSNPEFLREGCAVADLMRPDRIVIGAQRRARDRPNEEGLRALHGPNFGDRHQQRGIDQARRQFFSGAQDFLHQRRLRDL